MEEDFELGETSASPANGPGMIEGYKGQFLLIGGTIKDSTYDTNHPRGCILVFDRTDLSAPLTTSLKFSSHHPADRVKPYDMGVSEEEDIFMVLLSIAVSAEFNDLYIGRMADGHHNEIIQYSVSETDGTLTY